MVYSKQSSSEGRSTRLRGTFDYVTVIPLTLSLCVSYRCQHFLKNFRDTVIMSETTPPHTHTTPTLINFRASASAIQSMYCAN